MSVSFPCDMMCDSVWTDRLKFVEAENNYLMFMAANCESITTTGYEPSTAINITAGQDAPVDCTTASAKVRSPLIQEISSMRAHIKSQLESMDSSAPAIDTRVSQLEKNNKSLKSMIQDVSQQLTGLSLRVSKLEAGESVPQASPAIVAQKTAASSGSAADDDDDFDLFGDADDEEEETEEDKEKREALLAKYHEKKAKKPALIAKSNIILDVKPWDDDTDMEEMERLVRTIEMDGLLWGDSKLVPLAYGIRKLQISSVVEDDKVGSDILSEKISAFEDYVQSVDVAAFNKV